MTEHNIEPSPMLDSTTVRKFVQKEGYFFPDNPYISRCIDGRYPDDDMLPALAIPGADIGQIVMLFAAGNEARVEIDLDDAVGALIEVVGGVENIRIHTDTHKVQEGTAAGCGYFAKVKESPDAFGVTPEQVGQIEQKFTGLVSKGAQEIILLGDHEEEGVLIINGEKSVRPKGKFFIFHESLVKERNRLIVDVLFAEDSKNLHAILDQLEGTQDNKGVVEKQLSTIKQILASTKPVFNVSFKPNGTLAVSQKH
ncbi:MAG: hypothetical protein WEC80_00135 [Patescibacteria group bacterium]